MKKDNPFVLMSTANTLAQRRFRLSFFYAVPIGLLGGLIGLGGAEFRLPVIAGALGYVVRQAIPLNLAVSLITIAASLAIRGSTLSFTPVIPLLPVVFSLIAGAVITAFFGATLAGRLSNEQLERIILVLLVLIGVALIVEGFAPQQIPALLPPTQVWRIPAGILFGLAIGLVSSLLGVAGGEVIIPTLVFAFGADIKTAGTATNERMAKAVKSSVDQLREWVKQQPRVHVDESPWPVLGLKEWLWVTAGGKFCLFHPGDTRSRAELIEQLGETFDGVLSTDDYSVYNGYPVKAQQKCLAHLRRHFKQVVKLNHGNNPLLGKAFLDLIDEAFAQHKKWRETQQHSVYRTWAIGFKLRVTLKLCSVEYSSWIRGGKVTAVFAGLSLSNGGTSLTIQKSHQTITWL